MSSAQDEARYRQVADEITQLIEEGYYHQEDRGGKLPTQREMRDQFGVSNLTLRFALVILVERGLIRGDQGKGYFVIAGLGGSPGEGRPVGQTPT